MQLFAAHGDLDPAVALRYALYRATVALGLDQGKPLGTDDEMVYVSGIKSGKVIEDVVAAAPGEPG
nr:hypothetical protein [Rubrobacter aplysinae]